MPRSVQDSDDDYEQKAVIGRMQTRMFTVQSVVNSPLRRSSRIKQNKCSPGSESDSSISSTHIRSRQTATMDPTVSDTMKKLRTRKHSISSEISEIDIDIPRTPGKRTTRQTSDTTSLVGTPTRVNTRATSKRLMRADSETKLLPATRTTRKTRANSIGPESLFDQNKSQPGSPIKTRRRASMLPLNSRLKEQIQLENHIPYVRLDSTIVEVDETKNSEKSEISTDSSKSNETLQLSKKKDETQTEDINRVMVKNIENIDKEENKIEKIKLSDENKIEVFSTCSSSSPNRQNSAKEDKIKIVENLSNIEKSLLDVCEQTKELEDIPENLSDTSIEQQKSNKENQMQNIISDVLIEKNMQSKTFSIKSLASPFINKSLSEKEIKYMKEELNLNKRRRSRESVEIVIKHSDLSKKTINSSSEKMDISMESVSSTATDKTVSLHDSIEAVDTATNKDEILIESINTSTNEDATEVISELDKTNKKECTITDNKIELNEADKTSRSSVSLVKSTQISNSKESLASILTIDDNEMKLILEERSPRRDENEISSNVVYSKPDHSVDLQISSSVDKTSADSAVIIDKQSDLTQDKITVINNSNSIEQYENLLKHITESTSESSNIIPKTGNFASDDSNDTVIQHNQSSDVIEVSKNFAMDISSKKTNAKDILSKKDVKQNLKQKDIDSLEKEKKSSQMETNRKDQENVDIADDVYDVNAGIDLFKDIPADKWKEKNDVKTDSVQSTHQSVKEMENENETECDLILVDKRAWLAAETIRAAREAESFEYDSDDTVLLKSRLDASQANCDIEKLVGEELLMDIDSEENEKQIKRKSRTKKRLVSEIDEDSFKRTQDENNLVDKSLSESKTALNQIVDRSISSLNKSEQSKRTRRRSSKANNESDEEIENDANELNRSLVISKNISSRKSIERRTSLNNSSKDMQNKSGIDNLEEQLDDSVVRTEKKLYKKKRSLNKTCNEDANDNSIENEKNTSTEKLDNSKKDENTSLNHSMDQELKLVCTRKMTHLSDESDNDDVSIVAMDLGSKTYSMIANVGSTDSDQGECDIKRYPFIRTNNESDTDDSSSDSDINKEYNLSGVKSKFSDDGVAADECRASETEFSDSDDNGSDLADFIVDDTEVDDDNEDDEEEEDEDMQNMIEDDEAAQKEEIEDEEKKQTHIDTELINMENKNEGDEDVQKKDAMDKEGDASKNKFVEIEAISPDASTFHKLSKIQKGKNESIEHISPYKSDTETKQDIKMKRASTRKNKKPILLDSSNSNLLIKKKKKKSLINENDTILSDTSNLISSSFKKKKILNPQYSSIDEAERNSSERLNEFKLTTAKKLSDSRELMEFCIPNLNSCKKLELGTFEKTPENKNIKSNNTNLSVEKDKSKMDFTLNKDISLNSSGVNKKKISNSDFSPDLLELLEKTSLSKSSKIKSRRTMNIDIETPTLKHLRKEKLNESAPTLKLSTDSSLLQKELSTEKDIAQIKIKEKKNKDEVPHLITLPNDDVIQKRSQKKQKKRKRQESSNKSMTDEILSQDVIELNIPKKKKIKLSQLITVENNTRKDACQIRKKKKNQDIAKENVTDKALFEDTMKLKIPKKKKHAKLTQLSIVQDNTCEDVRQINKRKKRQDILWQIIMTEVLSEDVIELERSKKKKHGKFAELSIVQDDTHEDVCQINEGKKKKQDTSRKNIIDKALFEDAIELKIPKKKKRAKLIQLPTVENETREDVYRINEKEKKKKKQTLQENITNKIILSEDIVELKIKKKNANLNQVATLQDNAREDAYPINEKKKKKKTQVIIAEKDINLSEKEKKKKKKQINIAEKDINLSEKEKKKKKKVNIAEKDINLNEDNILRKNIGGKTELAWHKKKNKIVNSLDSPADNQEKQVKKKIKQQEIIESIETLRTEKKKNTLPVQIPVSKLKSKKILLSNKLSLQKTVLDMTKSKNVACSNKELNEAVRAKVCIPEESNSKKKRKRTENAIHMNSPSKKEIKEENKFLSSSSDLKRLSDDVIESLVDVPMKTKKKQKISRNDEKIVSSATTSKSKATTNRDMLMSNTSDSTTQFHVVNLQDIKKQSSKGAAAVASFRQRMLDRNNRESISAYLMFREKMNHTK